MIPPRVTGVYRLVHTPTGAAYVGSSNRCIRNRYSVHLTQLRYGEHTSRQLQELWDRTQPDEWVFEILYEGDVGWERGVETEYMLREKELLNSWPTVSGGFTHSEETKRLQREARARYLEDPAARAALSVRAKAQHARGKLGRSTWKPLEERTPRSLSEEQRYAATEAARSPERRVKSKENMEKLLAEGKAGPASWKLCPETGKRGVAAFWARMTPEQRSERNRKSAESRKRKLGQLHTIKPPA